MAAGSSERGLSSVTIATSARRAAISPMIGRLPGSRSPPQPNTRTRRPAHERPQARQAPFRARRACGRSRRTPPRRGPRRRAPAAPARRAAFAAPETPRRLRCPLAMQRPGGDQRVRDLEVARQRKRSGAGGDRRTRGRESTRSVARGRDEPDRLAVPSDRDRLEPARPRRRNHPRGDGAVGVDDGRRAVGQQVLGTASAWPRDSPRPSHGSPCGRGSDW